MSVLLTILQAIHYNTVRPYAATRAFIGIQAVRRRIISRTKTRLYSMQNFFSSLYTSHFASYM